MKISLRDYQQIAVEKVLSSFEQGNHKQLITLPTGAGKTIVMAAIARHLRKRTLVLAHREELITQAQSKFKLVWPEVETGIYMGNKNETKGHVVFGSVQSCCREPRLSQLAEQRFELLLIDEAHHANSPSYQAIIKALDFNCPSSSKLMLGVTATPMRSDNKELGDVFESATYSVSIGTLISAGYLSPVRGRRVITRTSLDEVHSRGGEFVLGELSEAVNTPERNKFIAETYRKYAANRKGIAFCCDVQHCIDLAEALNLAHVRSTAVFGDMDTMNRKSALDALKTGEMQVITSCGVLTEGYDEPSVSCIAMARPTRFKGLYIQCVGRGLRLHPSKSDCLVLDFADEGHNLETAVSLSKAIPELQHEAEGAKERQERPQQSIKERRECDEEFDILGATRFIWVPIGDNEWSLADDEGNEIVMHPQQEGYTASVYWKNRGEVAVVSEPIPLEYCSGCCEDFARSRFKLGFASTESPWLTKKQEPSEGQVTFLKKRGIQVDGMTRAQASIKIREILAKQRKRQRRMNTESSTEKQRAFLRRYGIDTSNMSKLEAMRAIANIRKA